ncbi:MAG: DUF5906 domain-containing protein [Erysipelotrichales bacterium]|nr:DUF5906 domain-containing protein [Erysipelotrichales bacterium]
MTEKKEEKNKNEQKTFEIGTIVRVSDKYCELKEMPNGSTSWEPRETQALKQDGFNFNTVEKYNSFTVEPDFQNYQPVINKWLNLFEPLAYEPIVGEFPTIEKLFNHIFGEQLQLGYDRFSLLLRNPKHLQPILVLASNEQETGKSTFLRFQNYLFKGNSKIITIAEYSQKFNYVYATKLCINIDESIISEKFIKEKLKQDSTCKEIQLRLMRSEYQTIPFYGKFTLCTNNELDFAKIEDSDLRFWVRNPSKIEKFDSHFEEKLIKEIPCFLHFLLNREFSVPEAQSRMWFSKEQLETDALRKVVENSISDCAKEIMLFVEDKLETQAIFNATATDLYELLDRKFLRNEIINALKDELSYKPSTPKYYNNFEGARKNGRVYEFNRTKTSENTTEDDDDFF